MRRAVAALAGAFDAFFAGGMDPRAAPRMALGRGRSAG
jgi:hypothetical protein